MSNKLVYRNRRSKIVGDFPRTELDTMALFERVAIYQTYSCHSTLHNHPGFTAGLPLEALPWLKFLNTAGVKFTIEVGDFIKVGYYGKRAMVIWSFIRGYYRNQDAVRECLELKGDPFKILIVVGSLYPYPCFHYGKLNAAYKIPRVRSIAEVIHTPRGSIEWAFKCKTLTYNPFNINLSIEENFENYLNLK